MDGHPEPAVEEVVRPGDRAVDLDPRQVEVDARRFVGIPIRHRPDLLRIPVRVGCGGLEGQINVLDD